MLRGFGAFVFVFAVRFGLLFGREALVAVALATVRFAALGLAALDAVRLAGARDLLDVAGFRARAGLRAGLALCAVLLFRTLLADGLPRLVVFAMILASGALRRASVPAAF